MKRINLHIIAILALVFTASMSVAKDFVIISISQDFPMYNGQEKLNKNFYINIGSKQGVTEGTVLDVYRKTILNDSYRTNKSYQYDIKVGQLEVIHSENESSIAKLHAMNEKISDMQLDVEGIMIGDKVEINLK